MTIFSRRRDDAREPWQAPKSDLADEALIIPPCDLWDADQSQKDCDTSTYSPHDEELSEKIAFNTGQHCWAFMGSAGGVGTTSLSVQIAFELVKKLEGQSKVNGEKNGSQVCLIDLDFETGNCAHHLDMSPSVNLEDLNVEASRIDAALAQSYITEHKSGLQVMAAAPIIGANSKVKAQVVLALLDALTDSFPYVILDLPTSWQNWTPPVLAGSDFIGLLTDMTIPSLHSAKSKYIQCDSLYGNDVAIDIILTKFERRMFKNTLKLTDAKKVLQTDIFGTSCADPASVLEAVNCGTPVGELLPESRYAKDSRKLLQAILSKTKTHVFSVENSLAANA